MFRCTWSCTAHGVVCLSQLRHFLLIDYLEVGGFRLIRHSMDRAYRQQKADPIDGQEEKEALCAGVNSHPRAQNWGQC